MAETGTQQAFDVRYSSYYDSAAALGYLEIRPPRLGLRMALSRANSEENVESVLLRAQMTVFFSFLFFSGVSECRGAARMMQRSVISCTFMHLIAVEHSIIIKYQISPLMSNPSPEYAYDSRTALQIVIGILWTSLYKR